MPDGNPRSDELWERAGRVIPGGTQTFSKMPDQLAPGFGPRFLARGRGSRCWDLDGHEYLDLVMALLPVILGYAHPRVDEAVRRQLADGSILSLPHPLETEVAERLVELIPCAEMIRFAKNGSDATSGAVRVARAATGRDRIACCGYHGWQDWFIGSTSRHAGVPEAVRALTHPFDFNDLASLEGVLEGDSGEFAAVILEPITFEEPVPGFLEGVQELARRHGALLIFDEIITGFRFAAGGAQELFGVVPDLSTFGKAVANGLPLSGVAGRRDVMELFEDVFFSFTFGGDTLSLAAARATLDVLAEEDGPRRLHEVGQQLQDGARSVIDRHGLEELIGCPGRPVWTCLTFGGEDPAGVKTLFQQECLRRGVLFASSHNLSLAHSAADVDDVLDAYDGALEQVAQAITADAIDETLEADRVKPVFRTER
jgi:glutamate-1-semialdehyde aminotransferase